MSGARGGTRGRARRRGKRVGGVAAPEARHARTLRCACGARGGPAVRWARGGVLGAGAERAAGADRADARLCRRGGGEPEETAREREGGEGVRGGGRGGRGGCGGHSAARAVGSAARLSHAAAW
eukprot:3939989-Rhodomonas_salina.1